MGYALNIIELKGIKTFVLVKKSDKDFVLMEMNNESKNRSRDYISVMRRTYITKILRDKYFYSFQEIAKGLQKDVTSIKHLYGKI